MWYYASMAYAMVLCLSDLYGLTVERLLTIRKVGGLNLGRSASR